MILFLSIAVTVVALIGIRAVRTKRHGWEKFNRPEAEIIYLPKPPVRRGLDSADVIQALKDQRPDPRHDAKVIRLKKKLDRKN